MLAERKTKASWVLNPRASDWSKDQNKLGQKMLEKMGWSVGKGLGAKGQGPVEAIRIAYKGDCRGFGAGRKKEQEDWLQQQESFQSLLEGLNGTSDRSVKVKSLEEKSKTTRTKIHYHKFARGKDISRYSEKDLSCIVGSGFVPVVLPDAEPAPETDDAGAAANAAECLEPDAEDKFSAGEDSMFPHRSRTGRELKPSAKIAAILEEGAPSLIKKMKTKEKPAGIETESEAAESADESDKRLKKGRELKPTKKKTKQKGPESNTQSDYVTETAIGSSNSQKDLEHSRRGRAHKPTAKAAINLEVEPPTPKKKKIKDTSARSNTDESEIASVAGTESESDRPRGRRVVTPSAKMKKTLNERVSSPSEKKIESGSKAGSETAKLDNIGAHTRSGREHKPSAKALASLSDRSQSPKRGKTKENASPEGSKWDSFKEPAASGDHLHSRSGREYKPSAKVMESWEVESPSKMSRKDTVTDDRGKRAKEPSKESGSQAATKKQKTIEDFFGESASPALRKSPKKKPSKIASSDESVVQDHGSTRQSPRKRLAHSESTDQEVEQAKVKKSKKKAKVAETQRVNGSDEDEPRSTKSRDIDISAPSKPQKKKRKKNADLETAVTEEEAEVNNSDVKEYSRKRLRGKKDDLARMDPPEESAKLSRKKRKGKVVEESDEPSGSNAGASLRSSKNGGADTDQDAGLRGEERKRKRKKKGEVADAEPSAVEVAGDQEEASADAPKKGKKKTKKPDQVVPPASDDVEVPSKTKKRKKKDQNAAAADDHEEKSETDKLEGKPKATKSTKNQKPAVKLDRLESSDSRETTVSGKQDSEDTEELASINSQSSLIYEMIGNPSSSLKLGDTPEELKKFNMLLSESEADD